MKYVHCASGLAVNIREREDVVEETTVSGKKFRTVVRTWLETDGGQKARRSHPGSSAVVIVATDTGPVEVIEVHP